MAKKSNFLKNLLTTASAIAVVTGSVQVAQAVVRGNINGTAIGLDTAGNAPLNVADSPAFNVLSAFANTDDFKFNPGVVANAGTTLTHTANINDIRSIDVNDRTPGLFTVGSVLTLGSVSGTTLGTNFIDAKINGVFALTLDGRADNGATIAANTYTGLRNVTFAAGGSILNVAGTGAALTLAGTFNGSTANDQGILNVVNGAGNTATFSSTVGDAFRLAAVNVGTTTNEATLAGKAAFTGAVKASVIKVGGTAGAGNAGGNGVATFNGVGNLANAGFLVGGNANGANNGGNGDATFAANATLTVTAGGLKVGGNGVGAVGVAGTGKIVFGADANLIVSAGGIQLGGDAGAANGAAAGTNGGNVVAGTSFGGTVLVTAGGLKIGGRGGDGSLANDGVAGGNGGSTAANATFVKGVTLGAATAVNIGGNGGDGQAGAGAGAAGGNGGAATAIFAGGLVADTLTVGGNTGATNTGVGGNGGDATATFNAALKSTANGATAVTVGGTKVGAATAGNGTVNFDTTAGNATTHVANVTFGTAASVVNVGSATNGTVQVTGNFDLANKNATINLGNGSVANSAVIQGNIISTGAANGALKVLGTNTQVTGNIGNNAGTGLALIDVGNGVNGKVTITGPVFATVINVGSANANTGEAIFGGAVATTGALTIGAGGGGAGQGTVSFNVGDSTIAGNTAFAKAGSVMNIGNNTAAQVKVTGDVDFATLAATLNLKGGTVIGNKAIADGAINNGNNAAILNTTGYTQVTGRVGEGSELAQLNIGNGAASNATFNDRVTANLIKIGHTHEATATFDGRVTSAGGITIGNNANAAVGHAIFNDDTTGVIASTTFDRDGSDITIGGDGNDNGRLRSPVGFAGKDATIIFGVGDARLDGAVTTATTPNTGKILINVGGGKTALMNGAVGTVGVMPIRSITVAGDGTVTLGNGNAVNTALLAMNGTGTTTVGDATLTVGDGTAVVAAGTGEGVVFGAAGTLALQKTGGVGNTALKGLTDFAGIDGTVIVTAASKIEGAVNNTGDANNGTLQINLAGQVTGPVGGTNAIRKVRAGLGAVTFDSTVKAQTFDVTGANAVTVTGALTVSAANGEGVRFAAGAGAILNVVDDFTGRIDFANNAGAVVNFKKAVLVIGATSSIDSTAGASGTVNFAGNAADQTVAFSGNMGAADALTAVNIGSGGNKTELTLHGGTHKATTFDLKHAASKIILGLDAGNAGTTIIGGVNNTTGGNLGIIDVSEAGQIIEGKIGATNPIVKIDFNKVGGGAELTVDSKGVAGLIQANTGVEFTTDGTLTIKGTAQDQVITADIKSVAGGTGAVVLDDAIGAAKSVRFNNIIGDSGNGGKSINALAIEAGVGANDGQDVKLMQTANIDNVVFQGATNLRFDNVGVYKIGSITAGVNANGNLIVGNVNNTTLSAQDANGANFGSATGNKLKFFVFKANNNVNIGDGVNIYATGVRNANGGAGGLVNHGTLTFAGNSTFDAPMVVGDKINTIVGPDLGAGNAPTEARVIQAVFTNNNITVGSGTLAFGSNVTIGANGNSILAANDGKGTLKFINIGDIEVNPIVGAVGATRVKTIEFNGAGNLEFKAQVFEGISDFKFTNTAATTVTHAAATEVGSFAVDTTGATGAQTINTLKAGNIGFTKTITGPLTFNLGGAALTTANVTPGAGTAATDFATTSFTSSGNNRDDLNFVTDGTVIKSIGTSANKFHEVHFTDNGTVGDVFAKTKVDITDGKTATFTGLLSSDSLQLLGANAEAVFNKKGFTLNTPIIGAGGKVTFQDDATISAAINNAGRVKLAEAGKTTTLSNTVSGTDIQLATGTLAAGTNGVLNGTTTATNSNIALGSGEINVSGNALNLVGTLNVSTTPTFNNNTVSAGHVTIAGPVALTTTNLTSITFTINDADFDASNEGPVTVVVNKGTGAVALNANTVLKVAPENPFTKWAPSVDAKGNFVLNNNNNTGNVLKDDVTKIGGGVEDLENAVIIASSPANTKELQKITDSAKRGEYVERIVATDIENVLGDVIGGVAGDISSRMGTLAGVQAPNGGNKIVASAASGVSAGEGDHRYGVWTSPFFSKADQKSRKGAAGYSAQTAGASFGFDTRANEDMIIGAALSFLNSDVKHKDFKSGDKTRAESLLFSIYGMQQITENWFGQAVATFGSNRVKTTEQRITGLTSSETASGKYTSMSFAGEALIGYNFGMEQVSVTPMAGIRATRINDGGYKEAGTTNQNLTISKKASNKFEVVLGARVAGGTFDMNGLYVTPEVHGFVSHDMIGKNPEMDMRLDGSTKSLSTKRGKPNKTSYNLGAGLNAEYGMMEYGAGYDATMSNKFIAHQGTMKVRVNF
jgi:hypothetical protein